MQPSRQALVVLSGGQDSTICLFWAKERYAKVHAITFDYAQRHRREIDAARIIVRMAKVTSHEVVEVGPILKGKSPLTNPGEQLEQYTDFKSMDAIIGRRVELTFVPMRNMLFLTIAANRATILGDCDIVTGVCQQDNANYPDCRESFILAAENAFDEALGKAGLANIRTPLMWKTKAQSITMAQGFAGCMEALAYSHTAYDGRYPPTGKDHASVLRAQGFLEAGVPDPLVVRAWWEGLMALPETSNYNAIRTADERRKGVD